MSGLDKDYQRPDEAQIAQIEHLAMQSPPALPEHCLPPQQYLEKYVLPYIEPAMRATALHRPKNPIEFFSYYLLSQRNQNP